MKGLLVLVCLTAWGADIPKFGDFPAGEVFSGRPAVPVLKRAKDRTFRTRIREGAEKGPNFAGHYTVAEWGCGTECVDAAMIDAKTGAVLDLPFSFLTWGPGSFEDGAKWPGDDFEPIAHQKGSRLLIVRGCEDDKRSNCGAFYYEWMGKQFRLLKRLGYQPAQ